MEMLDISHQGSGSNQQEMNYLIHSTKSPKHKKKRMNWNQDKIGPPENDHDILIQNDSLMHRTYNTPSASSESPEDQQRIEMFHENNSLNHHIELTKEESVDSVNSEDVRKVALSLALERDFKNKEEKIPETLKHIDYVLVYPDDADNNGPSNYPALCELREQFERKTELEELVLTKKKRGNLTFVIITCSFPRLCQEAEAVSLKMPLAGVGLKIYRVNKLKHF